jgi:hypothetical protein
LQLAVAKLAALPEQTIDQRRLAMIDVSNDDDVSEIIPPLRNCHKNSSSPDGAALVRRFAEALRRVPCLSFPTDL